MTQIRKKDTALCAVGPLTQLRLRLGQGPRQAFSSLSLKGRGKAYAIPICADIRWVDGKHWIMGDKALSEWRVQGTLPDGGKLDCLGCDLWAFRDGQVIKKDTYYKQVTG